HPGPPRRPGGAGADGVPADGPDAVGSRARGGRLRRAVPPARRGSAPCRTGLVVPRVRARMADDDDRFVVVGGRRWRRSDPSIPEPLRQELVDELMDARRAVKSGKGADDETATTAARARVDAAKRALGERGPPWW